MRALNDYTADKVTYNPKNKKKKEEFKFKEPKKTAMQIGTVAAGEIIKSNKY